jgi:3-hydroxyisobutyrate dehydrogenase-like beta-hydroxyacid dehydrogenase
MKPTVGLIGLGLMGKPMGRNLLKSGFPLVVWNRTAARADELVGEGAKLAGNPREVAAVADVLITIVSDPPALEEVLWGTQGAMRACGAAAYIWIRARFRRNWRDGWRRRAASTG